MSQPTDGPKQQPSAGDEDVEILNGPPPKHRTEQEEEEDGLELFDRLGEIFQSVSNAQVKSEEIQAGVRKMEIEAQKEVHIKALDLEANITKRDGTTGRLALILPASIVVFAFVAYLRGDMAFAKELFTYLLVGGGGGGVGYAIGHKKGAESSSDD